MYKKCKVIRLPAEETCTLIRGQIWTHGNTLKLWNNNDVGVTHNELKIGYCIPQHLYIVSDDEIKEGDLVLWNYNNSIQQIKIINEEYAGFINNLYNGYITACKKIIVTTNSNLKLPQIPQDFIKLYCEKGGINEIEVEYEHYRETESVGHGERSIFINRVKVNPDNTINIRTSKDTYTREEVIELCENAFRSGKKCYVVNFEKEFKTWCNKNI